MAKSGFHVARDRIIIAETFFEKPDLPRDHRRELVALIGDVGDLRTLKVRLKDWETSAGGTSSILASLKSFFSKEQTSKTLEEAGRRSKDTKDRDFLAALQEKVSREPLLVQLAQDAVKEAHAYFREFMNQRLRRLYWHAHHIKQRVMYHQVELGVGEQDQKRRVSSRNDWFDEINVAQAQADPGYVRVVRRNIRYR